MITVEGDNITDINKLFISHSIKSGDKQHIIDDVTTGVSLSRTLYYNDVWLYYDFERDVIVNNIVTNFGTESNEIVSATVQYSDDANYWHDYINIFPVSTDGYNTALNVYNYDLAVRYFNMHNKYTTSTVYDIFNGPNTIVANIKISALNLYNPNQERIINGITTPNTLVTVYDKYTRKSVNMNHSNTHGQYVFDKLNKHLGYYIVDDKYKVIYDTDYEGEQIIKGFVEGVAEPTKVSLTDKYGNELEQQSTTDFEFKNYNIENLNGNIKVNNKLTPINYYTITPQVKGYITGSVNSSCDGTDFKIRVYREDGFFIGDYNIAENGLYEIPNLNVHSSYDVLLYDLNLAVETQVNSRRVPTAYSVTE